MNICLLILIITSIESKLVEEEKMLIDKLLKDYDQKMVSLLIKINL